MTLCSHPWLLLPLLVVLLTGCAPRQANEFTSPEAALDAFLVAMSRASVDREAAWSFLGERTQGRLQAAQEQARSLGLDIKHPIDMLEIGWIADVALVQEVTRERYTGERAVMRVVTALDRTFHVELERRGDGWTVELGELAELLPADLAEDPASAEESTPADPDNDAPGAESEALERP